MMTEYRFRISNDREPPTCSRTIVASFLGLDAPLPYDGDRVVYLKAGPDPLAAPRRVLRRMRVGDNVFFPVSREASHGFRARLNSASKLQGTTHVTRFVTDEVSGLVGLRVWRIT